MARKNPQPNVALYNLRQLRAETQADTADAVNRLAYADGESGAATANTVSRWERGIAQPSARYTRYLATHFGVTVEELGLARQRVAPLTSPATLGASTLDVLTLDEQPSQDASVLSSQDQWLTERRTLNGRQADLSRLVAQLYPDTIRIGDTGLLSRPEWLPTEPIDLANVSITYNPDTPPPDIDGGCDQARGVLPLWTGEQRFPRYSYAIREIARPTLFENRYSWRLTSANFTNGSGELTFGDMNYFDAIDLCEAVSHESAAVHVTGSGTLAPATWRGLRLRKHIGDPVDLARRACIMSINTLTIRRSAHDAHVVLHSRSAANVATSGGIIGVMPAGVFQPSTVRRTDHAQDFDLWRNIMREYSEEYLGNPEHGGDDAAADYTTEPFASMEQARREGKFRLYAVGIVIGALDLWGALETVAVIDDDAFDDIFQAAVTINSEGTIVQIGRANPTSLIPFTQTTINELHATGRLGVETAFSLDQAWLSRETLLTTPQLDQVESTPLPPSKPLSGLGRLPGASAGSNSHI